MATSISPLAERLQRPADRGRHDPELDLGQAARKSRSTAGSQW